MNGTRSEQEIHCNQIAVKQADTKDVGKHYFQTKTSVEENDVRDMLTRLYNLEFTENGPTEWKLETSMSREDQKFMKILQEGATLTVTIKFPCHLKNHIKIFQTTDIRQCKSFHIWRKNSAKMNNSKKTISDL